MQVQVGLSDIFAIAPIIIVFLTSLVPLTIKLLRNRREQPPIMTLFQAISGLLVAGTWVAIGTWTPGTKVFAGALVFDGLAWTATLVVLFITAMTLILSYSNINTKGNQFSEYVFLLLNSAVGMVTFIAADDLIVAFIGMEIMSLAVYALIAMSHEQTLSKESAFKYFVLGSFASAIFLYGVALIYGTTDSVSYDVLRQSGTAILQNRLFILGWILVIAGFCFKVSIFPFHFWTPDVYQGAPTPLTAFMATGVKLAAFAALIRFFLAKGLSEASPILDVLQWLAVLTMMIGNIGAIMQDNLKRMLAYSGVAHSGYILIGVIVAAVGGTLEGVSSVLFYLLSYAFMNFGAFAIISIFEKYEETSLNVEDLRGLAAKRPGLALAFTICLLSLAGIPPTVGFFGKLFIFSSAISQGFVWLVIWGVVSSVISVYFYLRPIMVMYMKEGEPGAIVESDYFGKFTAVASALLVIVAGLAASPFLHAIQASILSLME